MLTKKSFAKINLYLRILRKRIDGYHELETLIQPIKVFDQLEFSLGGDGVRLSCSDPTLPVDDSNLVLRAADCFFATTGLDRSVGIHLSKSIPMAAGLGGGSSNAAVTLTALNELHGSPLSKSELMGLAAGLGSDVPVFLFGQPAICRGRGELIETVDPLVAIQKLQLVLIKPAFGVSTAWAYNAWSRFAKWRNAPRLSARQAVEVLQHSDRSGMGDVFFNSLEEPVFRKYPLLKVIDDRMKEFGAVVSGLSGSGSTMFGLFRDEQVALRVRAELSNALGGQGYFAAAGFLEICD